MTLRPGDAAPDFVLKDGEGRDVRLSGLGGRPIVLYFYPKDGTAGCTLEAKSFRDHYDDIKAHNAVLVGVSLDDAESHREFSAKCELPFTLLSDPEGRVHELYDAWQKWRTAIVGRSHLAVRRCTFLIDEIGIIRHVYRHVNPLGHAKQVVKDLERLKAQKAWGKETPNAADKVRELLKR